MNRPRPVPAMKRHPLGMAHAAFKVRGVRRWVYFGVWGSQAAAAKYRRFASRWPDQLGERPTPGRWPALRLLTHDGRALTAERWAREKGLKSTTIRYRLDVLGWPVEKALTTPARQRASVPAG